MYYLSRYLTGSRPAAAVAAVLFAFCPYIWARTAHIQLLMTAGLPFSLLAAHRMIDRPEPGAGGGAGPHAGRRGAGLRLLRRVRRARGRPRQRLLPGRAPALDARCVLRCAGLRRRSRHPRHLAVLRAVPRSPLGQPAVPRTRGGARILGELGGVPGRRRPRQRLGEDGGAEGQRRPMAGGAVPGPRHADSGGRRRGCRRRGPAGTRPPARRPTALARPRRSTASWPCWRPGCRSVPTRGCTH